jgi:cytochrome oxidase assembly protein ShyY1
MANKAQGKNWSEIQLAIAAVAITATLGFWNLFSTPEKAQASAQVTQTFTPPPPPSPTETAQPTATALALRPVKIIFGGQVPQQPVIQVAVAQPPAKKHKGGGSNNDNNTDGSGGGGAPAPADPPSTGSSK